MLCHCVTPANRQRYRRQIEEMFQQRHRVFVDGLGWRELRRPDNRDVDAYDTDETIYLLVLDDVGQVVASTRMNPTWARHQLEEGSYLRSKFATREPPRGPHVWEGSRLISGFKKRFGEAFARQTMGVLLAGTQEFCVRRGITHGLSIMETTTKSTVKSGGWGSEPLGLPTLYETDRGEAEATATVWQAGPAFLKRTRQAARLTEFVLYEAPPALDATDCDLPDCGLLESVAELRTPEARQELMTAAHRLREVEIVSEIAIGEASKLAS